MELAQCALKDPISPPAEAALLAVQFAWIAWNQSLGAETPTAYFDGVRKVVRAQGRSLWKHLRFPSAETAVEALCREKVIRFPGDNRLIVECTMTPDGTVRARWRDTFSH